MNNIRVIENLIKEGSAKYSDDITYRIEIYTTNFCPGYGDEHDGDYEDDKYGDYYSIKYTSPGTSSGGSTVNCLRSLKDAIEHVERNNKGVKWSS